MGGADVGRGGLETVDDFSLGEGKQPTGADLPHVGRQRHRCSLPAHLENDEGRNDRVDRVRDGLGGAERCCAAGPGGRLKSPTYASLKNKLDKVFSEWTRRSQSVPLCISCGSIKDSWKELQCGHFVSRVRLATRWHPENCHPQCGACNVLRRGNPIGYSQYLLKRYGPNIFAELDEMSRRSVKFTRSDLARLIEEYQGKLRSLVP